jgi:hypothetical protein
MDEELVNKVIELNRKDKLPEIGLMQNHQNYQLVCIINNLACACLANNYGFISISIFRFQYTLEKVRKNETNNDYINGCIIFLKFIKGKYWDIIKNDSIWKDIHIV